jgi:hypothetical protein
VAQWCAFIAAHDDLQQFFGGGQRQLAHSQVVDDQQRDGGQQVHELLALAIERGIGQFFQQVVGLAIQHTVAVVEKVDMTSDCRIVAVCRRDGVRQRIEILDLPLPKPAPVGAEWIAAYSYWRRGF